MCPYHMQSVSVSFERLAALPFFFCEKRSARALPIHADEKQKEL